MSARAAIALRGSLYGACFSALWAGLAILARRLDPHVPVVFPSVATPAGIVVATAGAVLFAGGAALGVWCVVVFVARGRGTPAPFDPPREFVATGPYRYVRNPMYVGGVAMLAGAALSFRSPSIALVACLGAVLAHRFIVGYEEPHLAERFGDGYARYREETRRWIPRRPAGGRR